MNFRAIGWERMTARFVISNLSNFKYVPRLEILVTIIVLQTLLPNVFIKKWKSKSVVWEEINLVIES